MTCRMRRTTTQFLMHMLRFIDRMRPNRIVYIGLNSIHLHWYLLVFCPQVGIKLNIHNAIQLHTIYKLQCVHYKIARSYVTYDMLELLSIPYETTKSYVNKSQPLQRIGVTAHYSFLSVCTKATVLHSFGCNNYDCFTRQKRQC